MGTISAPEPVEEKLDYGIYIGRFQPLHIGHQHVIDEALTKVKTLIIIVGSSHMARTPHNPFTYAEREQMLHLAYAHEIVTGRVVVVPLYDYENDYDWTRNLKIGVERAILEHANAGTVGLHGLKDYSIALTGYGKDSSSYYLSMFPEWGSIQIETQHGTINASDIRHDFFRRLPRLPHDAVSGRVLAWLKGWTLTQEFKDLVIYRETLRNDQVEFGKGPFLAADVLIAWRGKVLLITRGKAAGRGTLAMPGGFVEEGETFQQAAIREAAEETGLDVQTLEDYADGTFVADNPKRSLRGRIVSVVHCFRIPDEVEIPRVVGGDDASHADWYVFADLKTEQFYEDHHTLISKYLEEVYL